MADDLLKVLTEFHRTVVVPAMDERFERLEDRFTTTLRSEMLSHFDGVYKRLDQLEVEFDALAQLFRI